MRPTPWIVNLVASGLFFISFASPSAGQTLAGQLLDASTGTAIPLSRVTLATLEGEPVSFGDKEPIFARSQLWGSLNNGGQASACFPSLYLDGVLWSWGGENPTEIDRILPPEEIEAMEVYTSPQEVPARFAGVSSRCGVIAIWSKGRG
jgi:hypothetical protein